MTTLLVHLPNVPHPPCWPELPGIAPAHPSWPVFLSMPSSTPPNGDPLPTFPWLQDPCSTNPTCGSWEVTEG